MAVKTKPSRPRRSGSYRPRRSAASHRRGRTPRLSFDLPQRMIPWAIGGGAVGLALVILFISPLSTFRGRSRALGLAWCWCSAIDGRVMAAPFTKIPAPLRRLAHAARLHLRHPRHGCCTDHRRRELETRRSAATLGTSLSAASRRRRWLALGARVLARLAEARPRRTPLPARWLISLEIRALCAVGSFIGTPPGLRSLRRRAPVSPATSATRRGGRGAKGGTQEERK
jgi:hypothetical protein